MISNKKVLANMNKKLKQTLPKPGEIDQLVNKLYESNYGKRVLSKMNKEAMKTKIKMSIPMAIQMAKRQAIMMTGQLKLALKK